MYAKLQNGFLRSAPKTIVLDGKTINNPLPEELEQIRSAATSNIVLKIGTQSFNLASTTSWQRLIQKFTIENNNTNYIDLIFSPVRI